MSSFGVVHFEALQIQPGADAVRAAQQSIRVGMTPRP
jgi:hypothetical protein